MSFIHEDFMLSNDTARQLYHNHAEKMPIIDYHCHLVPQQIAENIQFRDITQLWLVDGHYGDHYKWRAMRGNGVSEDYLTGGKHTAWETFEKWAETVPYTMRNPLYHWTHLELSRVFGIDKLLSPKTAREIFEECNAKLATEEFRGQALIRKFGVEVVCTTDDPADDLRWHKQIAENPFGTKVIPAWRPDKAMAIEDPKSYNEYLQKLGEAAGMEIRTYAQLQEALQKRHDFFATMGCKLSDHGLENFYSADYTEAEIEAIFAKVLAGNKPEPVELEKFRSAFLFDQAVMDAEAGWTQQFHIGAIRNNNSKMFGLVGPDTGYDAIHDLEIAAAGNKFFDRITAAGKLAKTILYCLNPKDNEVMMTMAYTFNDGTCPGKMQFGSGWWFLDQEVGMRRQMDALSVLGLFSRFVGMLTDSRSFISYPRHEYFRRILCDVVGTDVEAGKLPASEMERIGQMIEDISYNNAKNYFNF
ncbi:MAG: glucuronate isomerase [Bacteroidales bacterium]|nr:glucuronate isomerase [Bacteroidales bacterium]MBQ2006475.1 glucuronate isomerase [Bacteroidales bacterium]MBQ5640055.1 glucuronate isomerase [Bacteroidales bacterium]